jgi:hypothetical protein
VKNKKKTIPRHQNNPKVQLKNRACVRAGGRAGVRKRLL